MTYAVYKYELPRQENFTLRMPEGVQTLHVDVQGDTPCLWALVNTDEYAVMRTYNFRLVGTGHPIDNRDGLEHIGTLLLQGGSLVLHLFAAHTS